MQKLPVVIVLDDDELAIGSIGAMLDQCRVIGCRDFSELVRVLMRVSPDLLIVDYHLDQTTGLEIVEQLKSFGYDLTSILFISASENLDVAALKSVAPGCQFMCKDSFSSGLLNKKVMEMLNNPRTYRATYDAQFKSIEVG